MQLRKERKLPLDSLSIIYFTVLPILVYVVIVVSFFGGTSSVKWHYIVWYIGFCIWFCLDSIEGQIKKLWERHRRRGQVASEDPPSKK